MKTETILKSNENITKDMRIDEIIRKYPQAVDVFMNYGLHCIGCALAGWETLEQGAQVHGMDKRTINDMIKEVNEISKINVEKSNDDEVIRITNRAVKQVGKLMKKSPDSKYLRIAIIEALYGNRYGFKFEKRKKKNDIVINRGKIGFLIDEESVKKIKGSTMDYLSFLPGNGFKIYAVQTK